jgi:hypothetical protein
VEGRVVTDRQFNLLGFVLAAALGLGILATTFAP